jgi:hypothetical protein
VSQGVFNAALDFGPGVFEEAAYELSIAVRQGGRSAFTPLMQAKLDRLTEKLEALAAR